MPGGSEIGWNLAAKKVFAARLPKVTQKNESLKCRPGGLVCGRPTSPDCESKRRMSPGHDAPDVPARRTLIPNYTRCGMPGSIVWNAGGLEL